MEKKQTAVQWLIDMLDIDYSDSATKDAIKQALQMEREQIEESVIYGNRQDNYDATETLGKQYYTQTFKP